MTMGSIQEKVTASILAMIRARRESAATLQGDASFLSSGGLAPATIREASFSDFSAVSALKQRWGLAPDSSENWQRLWRHNPALIHQNSDRPIGWVLEADGAVVGYMGNIFLLYRYGARTLTAVASHGLVIEPPYRAAGVSLVAAFYRQKSVDLYLTTTAIPSVGRIAQAFKSDALPQADYETVLFWILKPYPFALEMMNKLEINPGLARTGSALASLAIGMDKLLRRRWPTRGSILAVSKITVNEIVEDDFHSLWTERVNEDPRLFADRSPDALRWHFNFPGDQGSTRILCCWKDRELLGYAVLRHDPQLNGTQKSLVADILAKHDDPEVLRALLIAAYDDARSAGSYILEVLGFPPKIRGVLLKWNPYLRKYPACPFYYKAADPVLHKALAVGTAWYATPFDGDTTLIRPSFLSCNPPLDAMSAQLMASQFIN
ncbi:MAG: hypothetical protein WB384_06580 [Candidatus Sulfotelmatobacter sp.]